MIDILLQLAGYRVVTAANGHAAKQALAAHAIDLVLTDILMPDKDGIEVLSDLRKNNPALPVIAMSGGGLMPSSFYANIASSFGPQIVLQKPFSEEVLLAAIKKSLPRPAADEV